MHGYFALLCVYACNEIVRSWQKQWRGAVNVYLEEGVGGAVVYGKDGSQRLIGGRLILSDSFIVRVC